MFVLDGDSGRIVRREITYTPGLFKIFDEIIGKQSTSFCSRFF
jgi:hypothetical protein